VKTTSKSVVILGKRTELHTLVKGSCRDWLAERCIPASWSPTNRGWWVRNEWIADLVAMAEYEGLIVKVAKR
jgi:hypothetical protein